MKYRPSLHPPRGETTLSGRVPWDIEARWGMSHVVADLEDLELATRHTPTCHPVDPGLQCVVVQEQVQVPISIDVARVADAV